MNTPHTEVNMIKKSTKSETGKTTGAELLNLYIIVPGDVEVSVKHSENIARPDHGKYLESIHGIDEFVF